MTPLRIETAGHVKVIDRGDVDHIPGTNLHVRWSGDETGVFWVTAVGEGIPFQGPLERTGDRFEAKIEVQIAHPDAGQLPSFVRRDVTFRRVSVSKKE